MSFFRCNERDRQTTGTVQGHTVDRTRKTQASQIRVGTMGFLCRVLSFLIWSCDDHVLIEALREDEAFVRWCEVEEGT